MGKIILGALAVGALLIPGGAAFTTAFFTALGAGTVAGALTVLVATSLVGVVLSSVSSLFLKKPIEGNQLSELRLNESIVPEAFRKILFGETTAPLDVRYWETFGQDNNSFDKVIVVAAHQIESFGDFFLEDKKHTFDGSGNSNILGSAFRRFTRTLGVTGTTLAAGAGTIWTNTASMTGMAFMVLKYIYSQEKWPQGFPTRMTQVVKGALVYDPRLDSTVPGGSGTHRIDDQLTWEYNDGTTDIGRNPALQMLWYLIGWRILGFLVCGMGVKTGSINLVEFMQAANDAETQGFKSDCALSTGDEHKTNTGIIEATCGGRLLDTGGIYTFKVAIDDTASIAVAFDDNDVVGAIQWVPAKKMRDQVNVITGVYTEPADLFQLRSFPEVKDAAFIAEDGYERRSNNRFVAVQDPAQAQKLSRIELNQTRFQGIFKAAFSYKAMQAKNWDVVTLSLVSQGWTNELFRIIQYDITTKGIIFLTLEQTSPNIYVAGSIATIPAGTGTSWDPRAKVPLLGLAAAPIVITAAGQFAQDGLRVTFTAPNGMVRSSLIQYRVAGDNNWISAGILDGLENTIDITSLGPNTIFDVRALHISIVGVTGDFVTTTGTTGNGTALDFANVGGATVPEDNATVGDPFGSSFNLSPLTSNVSKTFTIDNEDIITITKAEMFIEDGEVFSTSFQVQGDGVNGSHIELIFLTTGENPNITTGPPSTVFQTAKLENFAWPAGATGVKLRIRLAGATSANYRHIMVNRGPVALPYVAPYADGATRQFNRGTWLVGTIYQLGDVVTDGGSSFEYINVAFSSGNLTSNTTFWALLAAQGDPGGTGDPGNDGAPGDTGTPGTNGNDGAAGTDGNFKDLIFITNDTVPPTPTGNSPAGWSDTIPGVGTVWQSVANKTFTNVLIGAWTVPVLFKGAFKGPWSSVANYNQGDSVTHEGRSFILTATSSLNNEPPTSNTSDAFWDLSAAKGDSGDPPSSFSDTATHSNGTPLNMRTLANGLGYDGVGDATFTVTVSANIFAAAGSNDAISTGSWPSGPAIDLTLVINTGLTIRGGGGKGGKGGNFTSNGSSGSSGGDGINLIEDLTITLNGTSKVSGGSGGGGGGGGLFVFMPVEEERGGGGGGGGFPNGGGGAGGTGSDGNGGSGNPGTTTSGGSGGGGSGGAGSGGNGGGVSGITPSNGINGGGSATKSGGTGGSKGFGVRQNGNIATISGSGTHSGLGA